jgi:ribosomal protein L37AE/L43A
MTGRIIYTPPTPTACDRGDCADKPRADGLRDGTIWECDHCGRQWIVWSGAQYNESFSAWKLHHKPSVQEPEHTEGSIG